MNEEAFPGPIRVPLSTAKEWEKKYDDDTTVEDRAKKVKSYLIPRESLELVLKLNTEAVRAYIGINDDNEKTLLFVGAKYDEKTGKYVDVYGPGDGVENGGDVVYDGSRPSPPF
ncbi:MULTISPECIES: hypothetical protein [unclassified Flavobacterium]|jgi:hypothetical protein|uniref:hypothetical protein n=1 Tax=unclassified Flavobacterium TaxID=196869 RepID=UPI0007091DE9|nr:MULTISPECIES: hypothetical protein [unclassified Flavobacterium]KRD59342.1 hypothetical protein ASE40_14320 [Flavobacterium sp. Root935]MDQ1167229.1 hypothetical protein [Flavobacterium sp. SORGH_AS_0622]TDX09566.1 hypothetical protein EDB96_3873 [Flavobacterium sp. S87F.05.LMB.W.Kidney.N]BDU23291.1 hypothetical protein FLGSB24_00350 [Flavobacterium sp. GSB-24]